MSGPEDERASRCRIRPATHAGTMKSAGAGLRAHPSDDRSPRGLRRPFRGPGPDTSSRRPGSRRPARRPTVGRAMPVGSRPAAGRAHRDGSDRPGRRTTVDSAPPGRSGWETTQTPHRSVLARLTHTAPHFKPLPRDGTPSGRRSPAGADIAPVNDTSGPRGLRRRDRGGQASASRARSHPAGIGSTHPRCP
jgi:hypothetical protein